MSEEQNPPAETTEAPAPTTDEPTAASDAAAGAPAAKAEQAPAVFDLAKAIDEAPADQLRSHRKLAGIIGAEKQRWEAEYVQRKQAEDEARAREKADEELRDLARQYPVAFADKWLGSEEARAQQARLDGLETTAQRKIAADLGAALHAIDEWRALSQEPATAAGLVQATQGTQGSATLQAFVHTAANLIAERRALSRFEKWKTDELSKERQALREEITADLLRQGDGPDLVRASRPASRGRWEDAPAGSKEFNEGWERARAAALRRG